MARQCKKCGKKLGFFEGGDTNRFNYDMGVCDTCESVCIESTKNPEEAILTAKLAGIVLTTETVVDFKITKRLEIITAECVFGMNIFRDLFAALRDIAGGRSDATQKILRDSRKTALLELRKEAHAIGANAVVGVDLDYSEFSGGGKSMLFLVASGTAVVADLQGK